MTFEQAPCQFDDSEGTCMVSSEIPITHLITIQDVYGQGASREPSALMTGRMGSQCDINCVYGDKLDDGFDDGCVTVYFLSGYADCNRNGTDNGNATGNATECDPNK